MKKIYQIEVAGTCNIKCSYCPHPTSIRKHELMSRETFIRSMELVGKLGQSHISLHNFGDPLLHPNIVEFVRISREYVDEVSFSTNGILLTRKMAKDLKDAGLTSMHISTHSPKDAQKAIDNCEGLDLLGDVRSNFYHDWAGTSKKHKKYYSDYQEWNAKKKTKIGCPFIVKEIGVILSDGRIASCCIDMEGLGVIGSVYDDNALDLIPSYFSLCENCHMMSEYIPKFAIHKESSSVV